MNLKIEEIDRDSYFQLKRMIEIYDKTILIKTIDCFDRENILKRSQWHFSKLKRYHYYWFKKIYETYNNKIDFKVWITNLKI